MARKLGECSPHQEVGDLERTISLDDPEELGDEVGGHCEPGPEDEVEGNWWAEVSVKE
jgi:hypothetical protein